MASEASSILGTKSSAATDPPTSSDSSDWYLAANDSRLYTQASNVLDKKDAESQSVPAEMKTTVFTAEYFRKLVATCSRPQLDSAHRQAPALIISGLPRSSAFYRSSERMIEILKTHTWM